MNSLYEVNEEYSKLTADKQIEKETLISFIKRCPEFIENIDKKLITQYELDIVKEVPKTLEYIKKPNYSKIFKENPKLFSYLPKEKREDINVISILLKANPSYFLFLDREIKYDDDMIEKILRKFPNVWRYLPTRYRLSEDYKIIAECINKDVVNYIKPKRPYHKKNS